MGNNIYFNRLKELWESMHFEDANCFAKSLGWDRDENILRLNRPGHEEEKPGIKVLLDIAKIYPEFNFNYLLTGNKINHQNTISDEDTANDPELKYYNCLECISKQKEIDRLTEELKDKKELLDFYRGKKETPPAYSVQLGEDAKHGKTG
jgi:hypothetical protein